jgi:hypothetical protein
MIKFLLWAENKIAEWRDKYDKCHICQEPADFWCESCDARHCGECESGVYEDVYCCTDCAPTIEEIIKMQKEDE